MLHLPATRQTSPTDTEPAAVVDPESSARTFEWLASAIGLPESSYIPLQAELVRLREELPIKRRDLARSLANSRAMNARWERVLEGLPCGVLLVDSAFRLCFASPAAERLLALGGERALRSGAVVPESLRSLLERTIAENSETEKTWRQEGPEGCRFIGVTCTALAENTELREVFVFILRDVTEQKRLEEK